MKTLRCCVAFLLIVCLCSACGASAIPSDANSAAEQSTSSDLSQTSESQEISSSGTEETSSSESESVSEVSNPTPEPEPTGTEMTYEEYLEVRRYDYMPSVDFLNSQRHTWEEYYALLSPECLARARTYMTPNFDQIRSVTLGGNKIGLVTKDGSAYIQGSNYRGAVGDGTNLDRQRPYRLPLKNVTLLAVGSTCFAVADGKLYGWGDNSSGQLGLGEDAIGKDYFEPVELPFPYTVVQVSNWSESDLLTDEGRVFRAGFAVEKYSSLDGMGVEIEFETGRIMTENMFLIPQFEELELPEPIIQMDSYNGGLCMVGTSGTVYVFGHMGDFRVFSTPTALPFPELIRKVEVGVSYVLAIGESGTLYAYGFPRFDPVLLGTYEFTEEPVLLTLMKNVTDVSYCWGSALALTADGGCWGWGINTDGVLGLGKETFERMHGGATEEECVYVEHPTRLNFAGQTASLTSPERFTSVICDTANSMVLTESGTAYIWGGNRSNARMDMTFSPEAYRDLAFADRTGDKWMLYEPVRLGSTP